MHSLALYQNLVFFLTQDRINSLPLSGPHRLSSNDLLCSILWHVSSLVRDRSDSSGTFYLPFDLRQMHVPDAYFGNAHSMLSVQGKLYRIFSSEMTPNSEKSSIYVANLCKEAGKTESDHWHCHSKSKCRSSQLTPHCSINLATLLFSLGMPASWSNKTLQVTSCSNVIYTTGG